MLSIGYAAPETIQELESGAYCSTANPAVDMWALGVIAFELLTGAPLFSFGEPRQSAIDKLAGRGELPWETAGPERSAKTAKLRRLKGTILACLDRNPEKRPSAEALLATWNRFWDATETVLPAQT